MIKKIFLFTFVFASTLVATAKMPWQAVQQGNAYWAKMFSVDAVLPNKLSAYNVNSLSEVKPDPSFKLINAAVRYQINELPNNTLKSFADSMMHVVIYLSGGSPALPDVYDRAGWWRLSYPVAMRYGLTINNDIDERFDFEKSTEAAMLYALDLQHNIGNNAWLDAFVNDGTTAMRNNRYAIDSLENDLDAVYKLMVLSDYSTAEAYAVQYFYGNVKSWKTEEMMLKKLVLEKTGIPNHVFVSLNPAISGDIIPQKTVIHLTDLALDSLKKNKADIAMLSDARLEEGTEKLELSRKKIVASTPDYSNKESITYRIKSGDNLGLIADKYGVRVSEIKSWNGLRSDVIFAGQKLTIYTKEAAKKSQTASSAMQSTKTILAQSDISTDESDYLSYKVKNGDTLWSIAKQFPGVSPDNLMAWNSITNHIEVGQEIKVLKSEIRNYSAKIYPDKL